MEERIKQLRKMIETKTKDGTTTGEKLSKVDLYNIEKTLATMDGEFEAANKKQKEAADALAKKQKEA